MMQTATLVLVAEDAILMQKIIFQYKNDKKLSFLC